MPAAPSPQYRSLSADELVFGLVYGAGTEADPAHRCLRDALQHYGYRVRGLHLSNYLPSMFGVTDFRRESSTATRDLQNWGDELRERLGDRAALAKLAVFLIGGKRSMVANDARRTAWLIRSLRRPEEVELLRQIYGPRFILLAIHTPIELRQRNAEERWKRWASTTENGFEEEAMHDLHRDERDPTNPYGQETRETFAQADFFVSARTQSTLAGDIGRIVRLIFGAPFVPPTRDEQAMYHAFTASLRSSEMGRQVGAAITNSAGDLLAVGTNDVPSGKGGLYWSPDEPDGRDFAMQSPVDSNTQWQRRIARELLVRMAETKWLRPSRLKAQADKFDATEEELDEFLKAVKGTRFDAITEFGRAVHAEMDAITFAARQGDSINNGVLVTTTLPCHNCTRHVIATGIKRVAYIYPYAKSLGYELHYDAIVIEPLDGQLVSDKVVFDQYIGVAPRGYPQYFGFGQTKRRDERGIAVKATSPQTATPRVLQDSGPFSFDGPALSASQITEFERSVSQRFEAEVKVRKTLQLPTPSEKEDEE